jgi:hypothetical protein
MKFEYIADADLMTALADSASGRAFAFQNCPLPKASATDVVQGADDPASFPRRNSVSVGSPQ